MSTNEIKAQASLNVSPFQAALRRMRAETATVTAAMTKEMQENDKRFGKSLLSQLGIGGLGAWSGVLAGVAALGTAFRKSNAEAEKLADAVERVRDARNKLRELDMDEEQKLAAARAEQERISKQVAKDRAFLADKSFGGTFKRAMADANSVANPLNWLAEAMGFKMRTTASAMSNMVKPIEAAVVTRQAEKTLEDSNKKKIEEAEKKRTEEVKKRTELEEKLQDSMFELSLQLVSRDEQRVQLEKERVRIAAEYEKNASVENAQKLVDINRRLAGYLDLETKQADVGVGAGDRLARIGLGGLSGSGMVGNAQVAEQKRTNELISLLRADVQAINKNNAPKLRK